MIPNLDDEIRAAFERLADRAPHPAGVQARLHRAVRMHRQRRALLLAGGVAAGVGVAGGVAAAGRWLLRGAQLAHDVRTPGNLPDPVAQPPAPGNTAVPLRYRPTWLPEGYVERQRATTVDAPATELRQRRAWYPPGAPLDREATPHIFLDLVPASHWEIADWRDSTTVNGAAGGLGPEGSIPVLIWEAGGGLNLALSVGGVADSRGTALAIARSVVPDSVSTVEVSLAFGWRPEVPGGVVQYETGPGGSSLGVIVDRAEVVNATIDAKLSFASYETEPVTVRGVTGRWFRNDVAAMVWLTLPDGRPLTVIAERAPAPEVRVSDEDVLRMIEELHIGPRPANAWSGTR